MLLGAGAKQKHDGWVASVLQRGTLQSSTTSIMVDSLGI